MYLTLVLSDGSKAGRGSLVNPFSLAVMVEDNGGLRNAQLLGRLIGRCDQGWSHCSVIIVRRTKESWPRGPVKRRAAETAARLRIDVVHFISPSLYFNS